MRLFLGLCSLLVGISVIFQNRYKIINAILAVNVLRKIVVRLSMSMPYVRERILPSIFGRSA